MIASVWSFALFAASMQSVLPFWVSSIVPFTCSGVFSGFVDGETGLTNSLKLFENEHVLLGRECWRCLDGSR